MSFLMYSVPRQQHYPIYDTRQRFSLSSPLRPSQNVNIMRLGSSPLKPTFDQENSPQQENIFKPTTSSADTASTGPTSRFQQRARDAASGAQISNRINANREGRKSAFVNRLRQVRRDERDARGLESFEKAEYMRDKRAREEQLRKEAAMMDVEEEDEGEMSPVEEREIEELVGLWEEQQDLDDDMFDDYDEVFMEVLSQQTQKLKEDAEMDGT